MAAWVCYMRAMRPNKLLYVDTMRGWAILMVIVCHQALAFTHLHPVVKLLASYGQTGVFLFFLASAFTLCNSHMERRGEENSTRNFFIRRLFRIAPLYYLGIILFFSLQSLFPQLTAGMLGDFTPANLLANVTLLHGLMPTAFTGLVPGGWSIGTEWAFYLVFPVLFVTCLKTHDMWGYRVLLLPCAILAGANILLLTRIGMANERYWFWYDSVLNQLPVFVAGILLFLAVHSGAFRPDLRRDIPAFAFTSLLAVLALKAKLFALLPPASAISFVFLFNIFRSTSTSYGLIEKIGRVSYSMYVFHTVFAVFATRSVLEIFPMPDAYENAAFGAACMVSIPLTWLVGRFSEKYIEQPFIAFGRRLTRG